MTKSTIRYNLFLPTPTITAITAVVLLSGCNSMYSLMEDDRIDYTAVTANTKTSTLDVPPDLTNIVDGHKYVVPALSDIANNANNKQTSISTVNAQSPVFNGKSVNHNTSVAPAVDGVTVANSGMQRWLVAKYKPEEVWQKLQKFWEDAGFKLIVNNASSGIMETEWAENRAKLPQDIIRRTLGKIADNLYSTSEKDKFFIRVERDSENKSLIYITHKGLQEILVGPYKEQTKWVARPIDRELEAQFLARFMTYLGVDEHKAKLAISTTNNEKTSEKIDEFK